LTEKDLRKATIDKIFSIDKHSFDLEQLSSIQIE